MSALLLDTETTGVKNAHLVELAYCVVEDLRHISTLETRVQRYRPPVPIEYGAMATHHITNADVAGCPSAAELSFPDTPWDAGVGYLVGHNIDFDAEVVGRSFSTTILPAKRICTLALYRHLWPDMDSHKQVAMLYRLDPERAKLLAHQAHSAATDVVILGLLIKQIVAKTGVTDWNDLWALSEQARVPTIMPFGKHKGEPIAGIPADYRNWLLKQPDVDPYLVQALAGQHARGSLL